MKNELDINKNYFLKLFKFYFAPEWRSVFTILYILASLYAVVFYSGNVWLALKFIFYTIVNSGKLLGLSYLFWGVIFLITLIIPFSISLYSMFLLYEIWSQRWEKQIKILATLAIVILVPFVIIGIDELLRVVIRQDVLSAFVSTHDLNITGD